MEKTASSKLRLGGIPASMFAFPALIIVIILHIVLVVLMADVNKTSNTLSELMQSSGAYQLDATSIQARNTAMSETSRSFIQMPLAEDGTVNAGPLLTYVEQLDADSRGPKVVERFKSYNVSYEVLSYVERASELTETMTEVQLHAIALMSSVYPLPPLAELAPLLEYQLPEEELNMPAEERAALANRMILGKDYAQLRYYITENTENCNKALQEEFSLVSERTEQHVTTMRRILWGVVGVIIVILSTVFILFYQFIVKPLRNYSKDIAANQRIQHSEGGIKEMQQLVNAFNRLWDNRNNLEQILRAAAENDSLTGLPNRYCMKRDMYKSENKNVPMTVVMFDVNYLKITNDSKGHLAGDELIRKAATCITECFGEESGGRCYRIGGDEFVAVITGYTEKEVERCTEKFSRALEREHITVSFGCAHTDMAGDNSFKELMAEADKKMYEQKRRIHEEHDAEYLN